MGETERVVQTKEKNGGGGGGLGEGTLVRHFNNFAICAARPESLRLALVGTTRKFGYARLLENSCCTRKRTAEVQQKQKQQLRTSIGLLNSVDSAKKWAAKRLDAVAQVWVQLFQHRSKSPRQNLAKKVLSEQQEVQVFITAINKHQCFTLFLVHACTVESGFKQLYWLFFFPTPTKQRRLRFIHKACATCKTGSNIGRTRYKTRPTARQMHSISISPTLAQARLPLAYVRKQIAHKYKLNYKQHYYTIVQSTRAAAT